MRKYKYYWLHMPTGKTGESTQEFLNDLELLRNVNDWNRAGNQWKYWTSLELVP